MTNTTSANSDNSVATKIVKQVEFYFSDQNICKDKFLKSKVKEDEWVDMTILMKFNRLNSLSGDIKVVTEALKGHDSKIYKLNEDGSQITRVEPLPENYSNFNRSVFVSGFDKDSITLDAMEEFFKEKGTIVKKIILFKNNVNKKYTGSLLVELGTDEEAKKLIEEKNMSYKGRALKLNLKVEKEDYVKKEDKQLLWEPNSNNFKKGSILLCSDIGSKDQSMQFKSNLIESGLVKYDIVSSNVNRKSDKHELVVRFRNDKAKALMADIEKMEGAALVVDGVKITCRLPSEDEEKDILESAYKHALKVYRNKLKEKKQAHAKMVQEKKNQNYNKKKQQKKGGDDDNTSSVVDDDKKVVEETAVVDNDKKVEETTETAEKRTAEDGGDAPQGEAKKLDTKEE